MLENNLAARIIDAGGKLRVRSALNPILWLCAIISIPCLVVVGVKDNPPIWLIMLTCFPVLTAIFGFIYLLFMDRDKLQSEDYQLKKRSLELIEQKGDPGPLLVSNDELLIIAENDAEVVDEEEVQQ